MTTFSSTLATIGHGSSAYWYFTRSTGLVALILLSATMVLGIVSSIGWTVERWPRFLSQGIHRNLSLFGIVVVGVHIVTTVSDGYVPITFADAVVPFISPYRPIWVGLGALTFDLMLAVLITSGLRRRIGVRAWRGVHWLADLSWPTAVLHGLGSGSDTKLPAGLLIYVACIGAVVIAIFWRLIALARANPTWRSVAGASTAAGLIGVGVFAAKGPLSPGWSTRSGTSPAVLAQISAATSGTTSSTSSGSSSSTSTSTTLSNQSLPVAPFNTTGSGTISTRQLSTGQVEVVLRLALENTSTPLVIELLGQPEGGGITMRTSHVRFGTESGTVTSLHGSSIQATLSGNGESLQLSLDLTIDSRSRTVSATISGRSTR